MAHPLKSQAGNSSTAKFKRMTRHYGAANPKMNKAAAVDEDFQNGPQDTQDFGVEGNAMPPRNDKASRRAMNANPIAAYKRGGRAHEYEKAEARANGGSVPARARGGRTGKGATHVNVMIMPSGNGNQTPQAGAVPPPVIGAGAPPPPAPPPRPLMMPPGAMGPGAVPNPMMGGPGMPMPRKRGGKVQHSDEAEDKSLVREMVKPSALKGRARGGRLASQKHHMTAGAVTGEGRLEKIGKKPRNAGRPQAV